MCRFSLDGISPAPSGGFQRPAPSHWGSEGAGPAIGKGNKNQGRENSLQPPLSQGNQDKLKGPPSSTPSLLTRGTSEDQKPRERRKISEWQSLESEGHEQRHHGLLQLPRVSRSIPSQLERFHLKQKCSKLLFWS